MAKWFDHYLKGVDNGVEKDPPVRYYVMGATGEPDSAGNLWRTAKDWPMPSRAVSMFFHEGGGLSVTPPKDEKSRTSYISDPYHPMSIPGTSFPGAKDSRPFEQQAEVRTFTSDVLTEPVEWTGQVKAELYVSSTARDTDFIVRLSDVYPDGRSILIMDYPRRARYREGFTKEVLMEPGKVVRVPLEVGWLSQVFNRGHRIRVTVASTGAPLYEPNPHTGESLTIEFPQNAVKAVNSVHHSRTHASRILAPIAEPVKPNQRR
jgi:putative CocE/NonD family hydrolase